MFDCLICLFDNWLYLFLFILNRITSTITGNEWLYYSYATFEIYARNAVDGTPVQYGDVVGLKYPYYTSSTWLMRYGSYYRPRSCSSSSKTSCARENTYTGFRIFKKLWKIPLPSAMSSTRDSSVKCRFLSQVKPSRKSTLGGERS